MASHPLVVCVLLFPRYGPHSNNEGRYHDREQAQEADHRGRRIYQALHPRCVVLQNDGGGVKAKLDRILGWFREEHKKKKEEFRCAE